MAQSFALRSPRIPVGEGFDVPPSHGCGPHRVFVFKPSGPPPSRGWPLLLSTDGNAIFDLAVAISRTQAIDPAGSNVEEGVIVAVGYPTGELYDTAGRSWDLTPPPGRGYDMQDGRQIRTGGAAGFLAFCEESLMPWLGELAPIDPTRRTLFGHSFGGLFALYALYGRPALFTDYVAASPSLYWEDCAIKPFEDTFFAQIERPLDMTVMLSAGEFEGSRLAPHLVGRHDEAASRDRLRAIAKVARAQALLDRFRQAGAKKVSLEIFPAESHMSVLAVAINRAIQCAFRKRPDAEAGAAGP